MYTFITFSFSFFTQIGFGQKKISCEKPSDFRLIEEGEFESEASKFDPTADIWPTKTT